MTETDAVAGPVEMPVHFLPYLEKYRLYKLFKEMMQDLVVHMPRDHLKHMKMFLKTRSATDTFKLILLISPELELDVGNLVRAMIKDFGVFVITRRTVMDNYEKHESYKPGCVDEALMSEVVKALVAKDEIVQNGWLMFDHPCTLREARCLQQDGVLPTITLNIIPTPPAAPPSHDNLTRPRTFFDQDYEGLKYAFKATLKDVNIEPKDSQETVANKCFNAIRACAAGAQGARQGFHATGAPSVYRVLLVGPRGAGRNTQGKLLASHFGLVFLSFDSLYAEAQVGDDEMGRRLRDHGPSPEVKAQIVSRRLSKKDCIDQGYVIVGFPTTGPEFEMFELMDNPPNRVIFLNADWETCKQRVQARYVDWCTGRLVGRDAPRALPHPRDSSQDVENELDGYFSEGLAEMRAAAGLTAWEVDSSKPIDEVQTKIQAAVMAAPSSDIKYCAGGNMNNARGD